MGWQLLHRAQTGTPAAHPVTEAPTRADVGAKPVGPGSGSWNGRVATLRKMGLGDALTTRGDGYLLSPELTVIWAD